MEILKRIRLILGIVCILLAVGIIGYCGYKYSNEYSKEKSMTEMVPPPKPVETEKPEEEPESIIVSRDIDWESLKEENPDIYAWIYVPGTEVDYPVLQHPEDDTFYLMHNIDGSYGYPGCIYTEKKYNTKNFDDPNTVLYGHKMKNGTMFSSLHDYREEDFFKENPYIFVYTPEKQYAYEIFAAIQIDDRHLLDGWNLDFDGAIVEYEKILYEIGTGIKNQDVIKNDDKIITLSTCVSQSQSDDRFIVQGKLVEEK